jgi:type I restriction enzyme S subunit
MTYSLALTKLSTSQQGVGISLCFAAEKEQSRIASHLDSLQAKVDVLKALQAATQAELDALLPAVLDRAFKGEL